MARSLHAQAICNPGTISVLVSKNREFVNDAKFGTKNSGNAN